jgi:hypothetical protein
MSSGVSGAISGRGGRPPEQRGDGDLSQEQWVDRFALRVAMLDDMQHPLGALIQLGSELWPVFRGVEPEVVADAEYRAGRRR